MTDLSRYSSSPDAIAAALATSGYELPHGDLGSLPAPHHLIVGDATLPGLVMTTGTLVVCGSLVITGPVDFQQSGRPIVNLVVTGNCTLGLAYIDGFLCVGKTLRVGTLIADSNWNGGVFVGGDLVGHTLVMKDIGVDVDGRQQVEHVGDCDDPESAERAVPGLYHDDEPDPRGLFIALRDSLGGTPGRAAKKPMKKPAAKKPAAKKPAAKKPAAKKPAAKKPAAKKPAAKKPAAKKPAAKQPGRKRR